MSQPADRATPTRTDAGFTLPELLIAMMISGILIVSISMAFTTVLRTQAQATDRLAESKDITFVQTWLPVDLSSALDTYSMVSESELLTSLAAFNPPMAYSATSARGQRTHRHPPRSGSRRWFVLPRRVPLSRGRREVADQPVRDPQPGDGRRGGQDRGRRHEIPAPPADWDPLTEKPTFAVEVTSRNQVILRPIGEDVTVNFESGNEFRTGGAGLSAENQLPTDYSGGFTDPSAPPAGAVVEWRS